MNEELLRIIDLFDEVWDALNLPGLVALFTKPDVGALIDAIVETLNEKRKKLLKANRMQQKSLFYMLSSLILLQIISKLTYHTNHKVAIKL